MRILEITFSEFFSDTKQLITEGICQDIDIYISNPPLDHNSNNTHQCAKDHENNLKHWLKLDKPLSYGHKDKNKTFETLLQAVVTHKRDIIHGLPNMMKNAITPSVFALPPFLSCPMVPFFQLSSSLILNSSSLMIQKIIIPLSLLCSFMLSSILISASFLSTFPELTLVVHQTKSLCTTPGHILVFRIQMSQILSLSLPMPLLYPKLLLLLPLLMFLLMIQMLPGLSILFVS